MNLVSHLQAHFPEDRTKPAVLLPDGGGLSYARLERRVAQFGGALELVGAGSSAVVAAQTDKCVDFLALYLATIKSGRVFLPLNPT